VALQYVLYWRSVSYGGREDIWKIEERKTILTILTILTLLTLLLFYVFAIYVILEESEVCGRV